uniref:Uncharacterized protein n=1 Tax=Leersia perrieri TaxID=77586 RepID=A0A0D9V640_9ORYZ
MKKKAGGCLGAPFRALARACDSACDMYVRGMSGCARRVPAAMEAVAVGRGFGRSSSSAILHQRASHHDTRRDVEDLVRAASRQQRRVAAEPPPVEAGASAAAKKGHYDYREAPAADQKKAALFVVVPARKKGAAMGTIAEDAPCEFAGDAAALKKATAPMRRGAAADGLAAHAGGFGAIKVGTEAFSR